MPDADEDLVRRFREGDGGAFDELTSRYRSGIQGLARRYVKNDADAADVTQETFLRAYRSFASFRGEAPFRSWLYRIGVNVALSHVSAATLSEPLELVDDELFTRKLGTSRLIAKELWDKVSARIATLPPKQRMAVELRIFHEHSFEEIAAIMGTSEDAAKSSCHAGVKELRGLSVLPKGT